MHHCINSVQVIFESMPKFDNIDKDEEEDGDSGFYNSSASQKRFEILENVEAYHWQRIYPDHVATWDLHTRAFADSILCTMDQI